MLDNSFKVFYSDGEKEREVDQEEKGEEEKEEKKKERETGGRGKGKVRAEDRLQWNVDGRGFCLLPFLLSQPLYHA